MPEDAASQITRVTPEEERAIGLEIARIRLLGKPPKQDEATVLPPSTVNTREAKG